MVFDPVLQIGVAPIRVIHLCIRDQPPPRLATFNTAPTPRGNYCGAKHTPPTSGRRLNSPALLSLVGT